MRSYFLVFYTFRLQELSDFASVLLFRIIKMQALHQLSCFLIVLIVALMIAPACDFFSIAISVAHTVAASTNNWRYLLSSTSAGLKEPVESVEMESIALYLSFLSGEKGCRFDLPKIQGSHDTGTLRLGTCVRMFSGASGYLFLNYCIV